MKRHYSNYFKGIPDFKDYRTRLVTSMNLVEIYQTLDEIADKFDGVYQTINDQK